MKFIFRLLLPFAIITIGFTLIWAGIQRPITIDINNQPQIVQTRALFVSGALRAAGIILTPQDQVYPAPNAWLGWNAMIKVIPARRVTVWVPPYQKAVSLFSSKYVLGNILSEAGLKLFPTDQILWNGLEISPGAVLNDSGALSLQYKPARPITLIEDGQTRQIYSAGASIGGALWQIGLALQPGDHISLSPETPLTAVDTVSIQRAQPVTIQIGGSTLHTASAAATVGQALAKAQISLQGLDYSQPAYDQPLPPDGQIRVVRVSESLILQQKLIPFQSEFVADPDLELEQQRVLSAGEYGIQVTRVRVRYEDGQEIDQITESEWTAKEPVAQKTGYGTKVVLHTIDTPNGTLEYWRAVPVYATSYSPCRSGTSKCYYGTSSGLPVQRGVIGVTSSWYRLFANMRVYVPGYGIAVIADVGGGIPGKNWIDLGFTDEDFEPWHQDTVLYFLTPVPETIPWNLP